MTVSNSAEKACSKLFKASHNCSKVKNKCDFQQIKTNLNIRISFHRFLADKIQQWIRLTVNFLNRFLMDVNSVANLAIGSRPKDLLSLLLYSRALVTSAEIT